MESLESDTDEKGLACLLSKVHHIIQKYIRKKWKKWFYHNFLIAFYYLRVLNLALITNSLKLVPVNNKVALH